MIATLSLVAPLLLAPADEPSFRAEVAPLLVRRCFACHGGRERKGRYSLDGFERLMKPGRSKDAPVVPGDPDASLIVQLVLEQDELDRMPQEAEPLPAEELELLRAWIAAGAPFDGEDPAASLATLGPSGSHPPPPETYAHPLPVLALCFAADGGELFSAGYREVLAWDSESGELSRRIPGLPRRLHALIRHPDGQHLAVAGGTAGESGEVRLVALASGAVGPAFEPFADLALDAAFDPAGERLAVAAADGAVRVYETATRAPLWTSRLHTDWVCGVAFTHDGARVVTASRDHSAKVFEAATGELVTSYVRHTQTLPDREMYQHAVYAVTCDPDGPLVATAGEGDDLHLWEPDRYLAEDGTAAQMETRFKSSSHVRVLRLDPSDTLALAIRGGLVFAGAESGAVQALDLSTGEPGLAIAPAPAPVFALAVDAEVQRLAIGAGDGTVRVVDLAGAQPTVHIDARP